MNQPPPPRRFAPEVPLPPYAHVPGRTPHPVSDPAGHMAGRRPAPPPPLDPGQWYRSTAYLAGIDLFNHGYYWEAHEAWEGLWHAAGRKGATADFLKGLIKLAAAGVKHCAGRPDGVRSHARRAAELWQGVARALGPEQSQFLGLGLAEWIGRAEEVTRQGWPAESPLLLPDCPQ